MPSLWFVVPAHGRFALSRICLRQLRRTCDALTEHGVRSSAVVIAGDENLETARDLGFAWIEEVNQHTSAKFNDGIHYACTEGDVDYVVPLGSDDWVDWRLFHNMPNDHTMVGFQRMSFVREDGRELTVRYINSEGGCGIRIWPRQLFKILGYRPADEDRRRGCDTSMLTNTKRAHDHLFRVEHRDLDPLQIVDWKTEGANLNPYASLVRHRAELERDPFQVLHGRYPAEALEEMAAHYGALVPA